MPASLRSDGVRVHPGMPFGFPPECAFSFAGIPDHVAKFIAGADAEEFERPELLRSAVVQKLVTIGEAAARVSEDTRRAHPEVPWPQIVAFRNILVHAYFGIEWEVAGEPPRIVAP